MSVRNLSSNTETMAEVMGGDIKPIPANMPPEIIYEILTYQFKDYMSNDYPPTSETLHENLRNFLKSNLTVNKTFYHICRILIYKHCNFTTAKRFHKLLESIEIHPELRNSIQIADFQELTSIGLGRSNEMNKLIQNLTKHTVLKFLRLTKNSLREFLACENIQDDLDSNIIYHLLKPRKVLSILDLCGCSGPNLTQSFIEALKKLYPETVTDTDNDLTPPLEYNNQITCLGLHDCTDLPKHVLAKTLRLLPELQKLDLTHTSIDGKTLMNSLPHLKNLSHLSLALCSQLTSRSILEFFSHHPAVTDKNNSTTLEWLNLSDSAHSLAWNDVHTMFLLKKLCQYGHNKTLQYLNLDGLPLHFVSGSDTTNNASPSASLTSLSSVSYLNHSTIFSSVIKTKHYYQCSDTLIFIKLNFPRLKSLSLKGINIPLNKLVEFLSPIQDLQSYAPLRDLKEQQLKFINLSQNSYINKWTIQDPNLLTCSPSLCAMELNFDAWQQIEKLNNNSEIITVKYNYLTGANDLVKWKCFLDVSYGRRHWIYKTDPYLNREDIDKRAHTGTQFDSEGHKIIEIIKQPDFLKFAQNKISLSCGLVIKSSIRRRQCYRDVKPPISHFLTRNGGISFGSNIQPIIRPRLPPGGWRILPEDDDDDNGNDDDEEEDTLENENIETNQETGSRENTGDTTDTDSPTDHHHEGALYWDRSINNGEDQIGTVNINIVSESTMPPPSTIHSPSLSASIGLSSDEFETELEPQNDEEYLNNPELQRRRSQISLFRYHVPNGYNRRLSTAYENGRNPLHNQHSDSKSDIPTRTHRNSSTNLLEVNPLSSTNLSRFGGNGSPNFNSRLLHGLVSDGNIAKNGQTRQGSNNNDPGKNKKHPKNYYYFHPNEFIYDPNDPITTERYQIHFEVINEYKTFGCVERGMYRYYGLKTW